jgi:hypothetical protein
MGLLGAERPVIVNTEIGPDAIRYQGTRHEPEMERTVRRYLDEGGCAGFVAGSDTHEGRPQARTAVLAHRLTRRDLFEALRERRMYAVTGARIELEFSINGAVMGGWITTRDAPEVRAHVKGTAPIANMQVIRNGGVLREASPGTREASLEFRDTAFPRRAYYYLRVVQQDADEKGNPSMAWSSPIWVVAK